MFTTERDAVEMYGRFCVARYGSRAPAMIREKIAHFEQVGDEDGRRIWAAVAGDVANRLQRSGRTVAAMIAG